jgi:hypothetical protein
MFTFLGAFEKVRKATISFVMYVSPYVRMEQIGSHWTDFHEIWYWVVFENLSRKCKFHSNLTRIMGTSHEALCIFTIIYRWILLRMRNSSDRSLGETQKHTLYLIHFCRKSCHLWDQYGKIWQNQTGHRWQYNMTHARCELDK